MAIERAISLGYAVAVLNPNTNSVGSRVRQEEQTSGVNVCVRARVRRFRHYMAINTLGALLQIHFHLRITFYMFGTILWRPAHI